MAEQNYTVFQRLGKLFSGSQGGSPVSDPTPTYNFDKKELLRTTDSAEFEREKLQAQQALYLNNQWTKIDSQLYQKAIYHEPNRLAAYYDYESMEFTPEISAALDIYAEEATTLSEQGYMLNIYSESKRIKSILGDLFNNILDIDTNLPMWTRNTCKFGDNFLYLKLDPKKGVIGCNQLPNMEIERVEKGMNVHGSSGNVGSDGEARETKYVWKEKNMEFNVWEVAHFRLLGDDRKLPYGTSMLEKGRRIWSTSFS